jgi:hypothetical protein
MSCAARSERKGRSRGQKLTPAKTSLLGVMAGLFALGCSTTQIEAVVEEDRALGADAGSSPEASNPCDEPSTGRFILSGQTGCLRRGAPTTVFGNPAFSTELSADCDSTLAQWDLTPAVAGTFTLLNVASQWALDVRAAADIPGTAILLYEPTSLDNQRFWPHPRGSGSYELSPRHAPTLCAEARGSALEVWPCQIDNSAQVFRFARVTCP